MTSKQKWECQTMRTVNSSAFVTLILFVSSMTLGDDQLAPDTYRITADRLGLPKSNIRTSEPFVVRIFKTDEFNMIPDDQPDGYPITLKEDYTLKPNELARPHEGVDIQSRSGKNEPPKPLEFKAGVNGVVVGTGIGKYNLIAVQVWDGSVLEFLHSSKSLVKVGDVVGPDTPIGVTGNRGAKDIHLHVQAKNSSSKAISPDLVFRIGQHPLQSSVDPVKDWKDFESEETDAFELKIVDGKVLAHQLPPTKWIVEVIGGGGRVDLNLGEFWSYPEAMVCSLAWSKSHPNDLRLTREREVDMKGK
jgi:hypothetical protein